MKKFVTFASSPLSGYGIIAHRDGLDVIRSGDACAKSAWYYNVSMTCSIKFSWAHTPARYLHMSTGSDGLKEIPRRGGQPAGHPAAGVGSQPTRRQRSHTTYGASGHPAAAIRRNPRARWRLRYGAPRRSATRRRRCPKDAPSSQYKPRSLHPFNNLQNGNDGTYAHQLDTENSSAINHRM